MRLFKGIKSIAGIVFGAGAVKTQARYVKDDMARFKQDLSVANPLKKQSERRVDEWDMFVHKYDITTNQLKKQYRVRRGIAVVLLGALMTCLYFIVVRGHYSVGTAGLLMAGLLYFRNNFRLYQIRRRELCLISSFMKHAKHAFKEYLPLKLSEDWQALDEAQVSRSGKSE